MLNHLLKFDYYQVLLSNERQQISYASRKDNPSQKVIINQIKKAALLHHFEISSVIRSLRHLVMLEEDQNNWYFITEQLSGLPLDQEPESLRQLTESLSERELHDHRLSVAKNHLSQLVTLYRHYLILGAYYCTLFLKPENLSFEANGLDTIELIMLNGEEESLDWDLIAAKDFMESASRLSAALHIALPESLLQSLKASSSLAHSLILLEAWLSNQHETPIESPTQTKAESLSGLYIKPAEEISPLTQRRQADIEKRNAALAASSITQTHRPASKNWQLPILALLFALAIFVSYPYLKAMFTTNPPAADQPPSANSNTSSNPLPVSQSNPPISLEHIQLSGNQWQIDQQYAHTGADSIRLDQVSSQPSNTMSIQAIDLSQNANLSFWLMTKPAGKVIMNISLYNGKRQIDELKSTFVSESELIWYMVNPLTDLSLGHDQVDRIEIVFGGDVDTLWIDDIQVDSYK